MKVIQTEITSCFGCPYYRTPHDDRVKLDWCYIEGRQIEEIHTVDIPIWCPLPDKEV